MRSIIYILLSIFIFMGCEYKPSANFTNKTLGKRVYTDIDVSLSDPQNSVLIKDAIYKALYSRLNTTVTDKKRADSIIKVRYKSIKFKPLQYDMHGYVIYYQADTTLDFIYIKNKKIIKKTITGRYSFPIRPSAIISTSLRFEAIKNGSDRAIEQFIAYLSGLGLD